MTEFIDENNDPHDDPSGMMRRMPNGALLVKRDRSQTTGMLWIAIGRPVGMRDAIFYDNELYDTVRVGVVPFTPAADHEYDVINLPRDETLRYRLVGPMGHEVEVRYDPEGPWLQSGVPVDKLFERNTVVPVPTTPSPSDG